MGYHITLNFTPDKEGKLLSGVCTREVGTRLIKAEIDERPVNNNEEGCVFYETNNAETAIRLIEYAFTIADGGSFRIESTVEKGEEFPLQRVFQIKP